MSLRSPRVWAIVLSLATIGIYLTTALGRTSPGHVATVHGRIAALEGGDNCAACHGGWFGNMTDSCLACHEPIKEQIAKSHGLHGVLGAEKANGCATCHAEHHGENFALVNRQSFLRADVPDPKDFDHDRIGFLMKGKHMELECAKCHEHADAQPLPEGVGRFVGLEQRCGACHKDPHEGQMALACATCHSQESFDKFEALGHDRYLHLSGGHAEVACATCHEPASSHSLQVLGGGRQQGRRECTDCHESPHDSEFTLNVARAADKQPESTCILCHKADHEGFRNEKLTVTPAQHAATGFSLDNPHHDVTCVECHKGGDFADRHPGREADNCAVCHGDPHRGQFADSPFNTAGCLSCHDRERFAPNTFTLKRHEETGMPLTGRHVETDCRRCHTIADEGEARRFRGISSTCADCHGDAHGTFFKPFAAEFVDQKQGECAHCHRTDSFRAAAESGFDHTHYTQFEIRGAHAQASCEVCHPRAETPDPFGRTFGRVAEHFGKYDGCATCHSNPHGKDFDKPGLPAEWKGNTGCARCHTESSFRHFPKAFEHDFWTGFRLTGAHENAKCTDCHEPIRKPDADGRTWKRAKGNRCAACHTDPHAGQFRRRGETDCARCHTNAESFSKLRFVHDRDARFRLGKAHGKLACAACHRPHRVKKREVVRYRPIGRNCVDCHAATKNPFRREKR